MGGARQYLIDKLKELMKHRGVTKTMLHERTEMSRAWLDKLLKGESDFSIDTYEQILKRAFGLPFDFVITVENRKKPKDEESVYSSLSIAIENSKITGTFDAVGFVVSAVADRTVSDRLLWERIHGGDEQSRASPLPPHGRETDLKEGSGPGRLHSRKTAT